MSDNDNAGIRYAYVRYHKTNIDCIVPISDIKNFNPKNSSNYDPYKLYNVKSGNKKIFDTKGHILMLAVKFEEILKRKESEPRFKYPPKKLMNSTSSSMTTSTQHDSDTTEGIEDEDEESQTTSSDESSSEEVMPIEKNKFLTKRRLLDSDEDDELDNDDNKISTLNLQNNRLNRGRTTNMGSSGVTIEPEMLEIAPETDEISTLNLQNNSIKRGRTATIGCSGDIIESEIPEIALENDERETFRESHKMNETVAVVHIHEPPKDRQNLITKRTREQNCRSEILNRNNINLNDEIHNLNEEMNVLPLNNAESINDTITYENQLNHSTDQDIQTNLNSNYKIYEEVGEKIHLGNGIFIESHKWDIVKTENTNGRFVTSLLMTIYNSRELLIRTVNVDRLKYRIIDGIDLPVKPFTPSKYNVIKRCYEDWLKEKGFKGRAFQNRATRLNYYIKEKRRDEILKYRKSKK